MRHQGREITKCLGRDRPQCKAFTRSWNITRSSRREVAGDTRRNTPISLIARHQMDSQVGVAARLTPAAASGAGRASKPCLAFCAGAPRPHPISFIPAHVFHCFPARFENSALAWSSVAIRLRCACSLTCWEHLVDIEELCAITSVRPETVTTVPPTPCERFIRPEPRWSPPSGLIRIGGHRRAGEVPAASTTCLSISPKSGDGAFLPPLE